MNSPAGTSVKLLAQITDVALWVLVIGAGIICLNWSPLPKRTVFLGWVAGAPLFWLICTLIIHATPGQLLWGLGTMCPGDGSRPKPLSWPGSLANLLVFQTAVYQTRTMSLTSLLLAFLLSLAIASGAVWVSAISWVGHPLMAKAEPWELRPFVPAPQEQGDWIVVPFFYALGAWPHLYQGRPVLYGMPYEKGPPQRFIGKIVARWAMPDVRLRIEGPKTPDEFQDKYNRLQLEECLKSPWYHFSCAEIRRVSLTRPISEMRAETHARNWSLRWFRVENPALPPEEQPQGIFLSASGEQRAEDRFILVNAQGIHQTLTLYYTPGPAATEARSHLLKMIGSLRLPIEKLDAGRAWIDRQLSSVKLDEIQKEADPARAIRNLAHVQALLISKISVDPASFTAYFHLAGTASLINRHAIQLKDEEIPLVERPLINSAFRYAQDVSPHHPQLKQIQNIWLDSRKN